jgi:hypothetical protein
LIGRLPLPFFPRTGASCLSSSRSPATDKSVLLAPDGVLAPGISFHFLGTFRKNSPCGIRS